MARYLTPTKICTLIVVESYLQNRENPDSDAKLLDLITQQLHPAANRQNNDGPAEDASAFAASLVSVPSNFPGRTHYDDFVHAAWTTADLDQLHHLFDRLSGILTPEDPEDRKVTPASPIGHFIRRCNVEWTRLRFADSLALLNAYNAYIRSTWDSWARTQPEAAQAYALKDSYADSVPGAISSASSTAAPMISSDDIDIALSTSIHSLQKLGARVPADLKAKLNFWLVSHQQASDTQNLHHFMNFFEAWRAGQYTLALEELHRYFDYSIASKGAVAGSQGDGVKVYYQYALLHLSVLHADFERWEEALGTMEECIATGKWATLADSAGGSVEFLADDNPARENQDTACLNFALSWLLYLRQAHNLPFVSSLRSLAALAGDGGSEQDELAFLKAKAKDGKHWSLVSSTLLEEAKLELRHVRRSLSLTRHRGLLRCMS
jgi:anaphase-promoting complex subunit 5